MELINAREKEREAVSGKGRKRGTERSQEKRRSGVRQQMREKKGTATVGTEGDCVCFCWKFVACLISPILHWLLIYLINTVSTVKLNLPFTHLIIHLFIIYD